MMRTSPVCAAVLCAAVFAASAQPAGGGSGSDSGPDIEMDPDSGSGSGSGSGSAQPQPQPQPQTQTQTQTGSGSDTDAVVKDPKVAKKWLTAAQQLTQKGDTLTRQNKLAEAKDQYLNAITAYQKAIEAGDDLSVYLALALVEDKVGGTPDAYKHLKLVVDGKGMKAEFVKKAQAKLDEITTKVGLVKLTITPDGTTISVSGKEVGESPLADPLVLLPGTYTASFAAAGYQPKDAEIKVEAGSESERKIALDPIPITVKNHVEVAPDVPAGPEKPSMLPLYIGVGATGAFFLGEVITGISAISQHHAFTDPTFSNKERKDAQSTGHLMEHLSDVFLVAWVGSAAFTAYWYQYKYRPALDASATDPDKRIVPKVDMIPWVSPAGGGVAAVGSF